MGVGISDLPVTHEIDEEMGAVSVKSIPAGNRKTANHAMGQMNDQVIIRNIKT